MLGVFIEIYYRRTTLEINILAGDDPTTHAISQNVLHSKTTERQQDE